MSSESSELNSVKSLLLEPMSKKLVKGGLPLKASKAKAFTSRNGTQHNPRKYQPSKQQDESANDSEINEDSESADEDDSEEELETSELEEEDDSDMDKPRVAQWVDEDDLEVSEAESHEDKGEGPSKPKLVGLCMYWGWKYASNNAYLNRSLSKMDFRPYLLEVS